MKYSMKCTCGHVMVIDAESREDATLKFTAGMTQEALDAHWAENHQSDTNHKPSLEQAHAGIEQMVVEGDLNEQVEQPVA